MVLWVWFPLEATIFVADFEIPWCKFLYKYARNVRFVLFRKNSNIYILAYEISTHEVPHFFKGRIALFLFEITIITKLVQTYCEIWHKSAERKWKTYQIKIFCRFVTTCTLNKVQRIHVILRRSENTFSLLQWVSVRKQILRYKRIKKMFVPKIIKFSVSSKAICEETTWNFNLIFFTNTYECNAE